MNLQIPCENNILGWWRLRPRSPTLHFRGAAPLELNFCSIRTANLDPEVEAALVDASLEFSQCMRDQGIDFPDPKPGEFGFFAFRDADIDFNSEAVQDAFEICQPENPLDDLDD